MPLVQGAHRRHEADRRRRALQRLACLRDRAHRSHAITPSRIGEPDRGLGGARTGSAGGGRSGGAGGWLAHSLGPVPLHGYRSRRWGAVCCEAVRPETVTAWRNSVAPGYGPHARRTTFEAVRSATERREALKELLVTARGCTRCAELAATRTTVVFGAGNADAELMFVGEAPGANEDLQGLPFVGAAGKLLETLLGEIGLSRAEVFIANVLKCRPPGNRDPRPGEIENCTPYLIRQIELVAPRVICTLGNFATKLLRADPAGITRVHGHAEVRTIGSHTTRLFPIYHPAAALYTPPHDGGAARGLPRAARRSRAARAGPRRGARAGARDARARPGAAGPDRGGRAASPSSWGCSERRRGGL